MENQLSFSLYKNSTLSLIDGYNLIEKFIIETRLAFVDHIKLFDLLKVLLPQEENRLNCQGFLSWIISRLEHVENSPRPNETHDVETFKRRRTNQFDIPLAIPRHFSRENSPRSNVDYRRTSNQPQNSFQLAIKSEQIEQTPSETEDDTSDLRIPLRDPLTSSTSRISSYTQPIGDSTTIYNGRDMMKYLRPRTTITSFARHVVSDLYSREEIMDKLHVDRNDERDIFLRRCVQTAWNLTDQQFHSLWPKIRNALLQLRRDAVAGKCIRVNTSRDQSSHLHHRSISDDDDDYDEEDFHHQSDRMSCR